MGGKGRILVLDDEEPIRKIVTQMLRKLGYEAETVGDGQQALERCRAGRQANRSFDVAIMDLTVPGGMGGQQALAPLRTIEPGIAAIVSSGYSHDKVLANAHALGFDGVLAKPYDLHQLAQVLSETLAAHPPRPAPPPVRCPPRPLCSAPSAPVPSMRDQAFSL